MHSYRLIRNVIIGGVRYIKGVILPDAAVAMVADKRMLKSIARVHQAADIVKKSSEKLPKSK